MITTCHCSERQEQQADDTNLGHKQANATNFGHKQAVATNLGYKQEDDINLRGAVPLHRGQ